MDNDKKRTGRSKYRPCDDTPPKKGMVKIPIGPVLYVDMAKLMKTIRDDPNIKLIDNA